MSDISERKKPNRNGSNCKNSWKSCLSRIASMLSPITECLIAWLKQSGLRRAKIISPHLCLSSISISLKNITTAKTIFRETSSTDLEYCCDPLTSFFWSIWRRRVCVVITWNRWERRVGRGRTLSTVVIKKTNPVGAFQSQPVADYKPWGQCADSLAESDARCINRQDR